MHLFSCVVTPEVISVFAPDAAGPVPASVSVGGEFVGSILVTAAGCDGATVVTAPGDTPLHIMDLVEYSIEPSEDFEGEAVVLIQ